MTDTRMRSSRARSKRARSGEPAASGPARRVLALDVDGVMHPLNAGTDSLFCRLGLFEAWLRQRPDVSVVISSSWREAHPLDEMRSFFSVDVQPRVVGMTPVLQKQLALEQHGSPQEIAVMRYQRQAEIERWLIDAGRQHEDWVALDDDASLFAPAQLNLVLTDPSVGLTTQTLALVDAVFRGLVFMRTRLAAADMLTVAQTLEVLGISEDVLMGWIGSNRVLALGHPALGLHMPKWQFEQPLLGSIQALASARGGSAWDLLSWLETPHGALDGITPRAAIERGNVSRVVELAGNEP